MKISELIKAANEKYMPLKKEEFKAKKEGRELTNEQKDDLLNAETTLNFYKILKGIFMEQVTKNKDGMIDQLVADGKLHRKTVKAKDANNKDVDVEVVIESMDEQIDLVPETVYKPLFEEMVKGHKKNLEELYRRGELIEIAKETIELNILNSFLPKEATPEDVENWLKENYPDGLDIKQMGPTIGKVKKAFERADGRMVQEVVKKFASK